MYLNTERSPLSNESVQIKQLSTPTVINMTGMLKNKFPQDFFKMLNTDEALQGLSQLTREKYCYELVDFIKAYQELKSTVISYIQESRISSSYKLNDSILDSDNETDTKKPAKLQRRKLPGSDDYGFERNVSMSLKSEKSQLSNSELNSIHSSDSNDNPNQDTLPLEEILTLENTNVKNEASRHKINNSKGTQSRVELEEVFQHLINEPNSKSLYYRNLKNINVFENDSPRSKIVQTPLPHNKILESNTKVKPKVVPGYDYQKCTKIPIGPVHRRTQSSFSSTDSTKINPFSTVSSAGRKSILFFRKHSSKKTPSSLSHNSNNTTPEINSSYSNLAPTLELSPLPSTISDEILNYSLKQVEGKELTLDKCLRLAYDEELRTRTGDLKNKDSLDQLSRIDLKRKENLMQISKSPVPLLLIPYYLRVYRRFIFQDSKYALNISGLLQTSISSMFNNNTIVYGIFDIILENVLEMLYTNIYIPEISKKRRY
ncbi:hypothetical protein BB560_000157 [Smittium megazygosporum]|uniref:RGS domain-containing protein n=1 Tax=Smittium megazygosporum TaxID=133381 RepID=A0A2T9ZL35_9FUNG|nr:hypothetical protein BB560_000157 [Smittium megazygosporum]